VLFSPAFGGPPEPVDCQSVLIARLNFPKLIDFLPTPRQADLFCV
jgi:hypothetical protein